MNLCQTGDRYVTLGTPKGGRPGIVEPGVLVQRFPTDQSACAAALAAFETYAEGKDGVLYWRAKPTMDRDAPGCVVRLRLVISAAPERWASVNDFIAEELVVCGRR